MRPSVGTSPTARSMVMRSESDVYQIWRPKPQRSSDDRARRNSTSVRWFRLARTAKQDVSPFGHSVNTARHRRRPDHGPRLQPADICSAELAHAAERDRCCSSSPNEPGCLYSRPTTATARDVFDVKHGPRISALDRQHFVLHHLSRSRRHRPQLPRRWSGEIQLTNRPEAAGPLRQSARPGLHRRYHASRGTRAVPAGHVQASASRSRRAAVSICRAGHRARSMS